MKRNKLYTVNKWNQPAFVDRTYQNIYDGFGTSFLNSANSAVGEGGIKGALSFGGIGGLGSSLGSAAGNMLKGGLSGIGSAVGGAIGSAIGGGYESGVGNALGSLGKVASVIPGPWGAAISGGLQVLGGGINALWGTKVDEAKLKANQEGTNTLLNFASNAGSFDDIKGVTASSNVQDAYSGGVFKKDWAERKNAEIRKLRNDALAFADRSVGNNIVNLAGDQMSEDLANYAAYGGPINSFGSGALGIMQNDKYLEAINNRTEAIAKNNSLGLGAYTGGAKTFDDGGQLGAAFMDDFSTDPIGAAVRYNRGMEQLAAQKEAAAAEAARELEYADMQKRLAGLETQNQGLQALMAAQSIPSTPEIPETEEAPVSSSPSVAARTQSSGNSNWDYILDQLQRSGKFNDVQIEGIKYNLQRESGIGQYDGGDNGTARGLAQWRGARIPKDMSLEGQTKYLIDTLSNYDGKLHWIGRRNYEGFMNARTPEEAHYWIARGYERPAQSIVDKVKRDSDMSLRRLNAFGGGLNRTYSIGDVIDVTEEQVKQLKALGYGYEVIG